MGGHQAGEVASEITVSTIRNACTPAPTGADDQIWPILTYQILLRLLSMQIRQSSVHLSRTRPNKAWGQRSLRFLRDSSTQPTQTPFALGLVNVGDSRAYVLRQGRLRQVSKDHSFVQDLVDQGQITKEEARNHPRRNIVTRALGIEPDVRVDSAKLPLIKGDRFLLCSDGLVDEIDDEHIEEILNQHTETQTAADALLQAANDNGGRDNITVIVADVLEGDELSQPTEEYDIDALFDADEITSELAAIEVDADPGHEPTPPEGIKSGKMRRSSRQRRFMRSAISTVAIALIVVTMSITGAWIRSGYSVSFTESGTVMIYRGRDLLWFSPTEEAPGQFRREQLDSLSVNMVEENRHFKSLDAAAQFVQSLTTVKRATTTLLFRTIKRYCLSAERTAQ